MPVQGLKNGFKPLGYKGYFAIIRVLVYLANGGPACYTVAGRQTGFAGTTAGRQNARIA